MHPALCRLTLYQIYLTLFPAYDTGLLLNDTADISQEFHIGSPQLLDI